MKSYKDIAKDALFQYKQIWDSLSSVRQKRVWWQHQRLLRDLKDLIAFLEQEEK